MRLFEELKIRKAGKPSITVDDDISEVFNTAPMRADGLY